MAAELVGGSLLSAFLQVMLDRIASPDVVAFLRGKKSTQESLQTLKTTLYAVRAVLYDADQKQIRDSTVKNWLDDLKDAVYRADDLIDEISTKTATQDEVGNFFCCSFNLYDRRVRYKIEDIVNRLESILKHKDILGLRDSVVRENWSWRHHSTSLVDEFDVFGRDNDREAIIELLISDDINDNKISVMPIVGMGGIGKTTLAQLVYNNDQVKQKFDVRAWVCVSEEFDVSKVTKNIIESITSHACHMRDLNLLQLDLKERLSGKKFLIVLDDIWNENYVDWDLLQRPFQYGIEGSKILLTTRSEKVASTVQTIPPYRVGQLTDNDCWSIFAKHARLCINSIVDSNLERIGKDIVKKCKGLPLVAKTLGGLLRFKLDVKDWNNILKSEMWELSEEESEILPALRISYHYLSPQLKQCFLYCSMFPKDYEFEKDELILWWMAEGFLESPMKEKTLEEVGEEYLNDLVSRSFFQPLYNKYTKYFVMHDLIHDLATIEARKFYNYSSSKGNEITSLTHHLFCGDDGDFSSISKAKYLRTIIIGKEYGGLVPLDIFSKHKCLRVLSLYKGLSKALPDSVNGLIHLRYLNLSHTSIKKLPDTLCDLYNLQTLILRGCDGLTKLPNDMPKLVNLRYLDVNESRLQAMPRGIGKLKNLHFLSDFVLDKVEGAGIVELGGLQNLCNSLKIKNLQHVANGEEASEARLQDKPSIEILNLIWSDSGDIVDSRDILDNLQPHVNLKFLTINGYRTTIFPHWLGHPLYHNLTHMIFYDCTNCYLLPPLGQLPSLKLLEIEGFHALVKIGPEFYKNDDSSLAPTFPSLQHLEFRNMLSWQEWWYSDNANAFPQLRNLTLKGCPRLSDNLPNHLPDLEALRIDGCEQLAASPIPRARAIYVGGCRRKEFLRQHHCEYVESMIIVNSCDSLICLPLDDFPNLQQLIINGCGNLKSVLSSKLPLQHLKRFKLIDCPSLTSFPIEGLSAPNMTHLEFVGCYNLKSLLNHMMSLPKLQYISLRDSPGIQWVPGGGLPPNLISFDIDHLAFSGICCSMEWHSLRSLTFLSINGSYDESVQLFPEEGLLPPSLVILSICNYSSLETLDSQGFVHLTSLQELRIRECPKLQRIKGQRLPTSLAQLNIYRCSLLGEQCRTKNADIWPIMSHIPEILVDNIRVL